MLLDGYWMRNMVKLMLKLDVIDKDTREHVARRYFMFNMIESINFKGTDK